LLKGQLNWIAHVNLDLGIAAVATIAGGQIEGIHKDFDAINTTIGSLTYQVINEINRMSPLMSIMGLHADRTDSILIQFSIGNARDCAWCFAEDLRTKSGGDYTAAIKARDQDITTLAGALTRSTGLLRFTLWVVHLFEWKRPAEIIAALFGFSKTFMKANMLR
jgi:Family of unknown function (DUF5995)